MKKSLSILILLSLIALLSAGEYPKVKVGGRVMAQYSWGNNLKDFAAYSDSTNNDKKSLGEMRVDLKFSTKVSENISTKIATRLEGKTKGDKYVEMGGSDTEDKIKDATFKLQEAYVKVDKLFGKDFLSMTAGRRALAYGKENVLGVSDRCDGFTFSLKKDNFWADLHYWVKEEFDTSQDNGADFDEWDDVDADHDEIVWGTVIGADKLMDKINGHAYFLRRAENQYDGPDKDPIKDAINVFGFYSDAKLFDGKLNPYLEMAVQSGSNDADSCDYSGMLLDFGATFNHKIDGAGKFDAEFEYFRVSGQDDSEDKTYWQGIGYGNREEGYLYTYHKDAKILKDKNITNSKGAGMQMIKLCAGFAPEAVKNLHVKLAYFMFGDTSSDQTVEIDGTDKEVSGENIVSEMNFVVTYKLSKKTKLYGGFAMISPNKDYFVEDGDSIREDSATALWSGIQVKW